MGKMKKLLRDSSFWALVIAVMAILTGTLIVYRNLNKQNAAALAIIRNGNCIDHLNDLHALELSELLTKSSPNFSEQLRSRVAGMQGIWTNPQDSILFQEIAQGLIATHPKQLDPAVESRFQRLSATLIERIDKLSTLRRQYFEENLNAVIVLITTAVGLFLFSIWSISRTMTLRRKKELAELETARIKESNDLFSTSFEFAPIGKALVGLNGQWLRVNKSLCNMLGYSKEELSEKTFQDLTHPDDLELDLHHVQQLLSGKINNYQIEKRYLHKNGGIVWAMLAVTLVRKADQQPDYFISQVEDITRRKEIEQALAESENKNRAIVTNSLQAVLLGRPSGQILEANPAACEMFGYSLEEFRQIGRDKIFDPADQRLQAILEMRSKTGKAKGEITGFRKNGEKFPLYLSVATFRDREDRIMSSVSMVDLTEVKQAEAALRAEKEKLVNVLEGTHAGTWEWNVQTGEARFNEIWAELLGYTLQELAPISIQTWNKLVHPDDLEISNRKLAACFSGQTNFYECECRMLHKDGHWVWILDKGKVLRWTPDGKPLWMFGTNTDISSLKAAQKIVEESELKFRSIFNSAFQFIGLLNPEGTVIDANKTALEFGNLHPKDVMGKKFWECHWWRINPETQHQLEAAIHRAARGETVSYEVSVWDQYRQPVHILFNLKPLKDATGKVVAIIPEGRPIQEIVEAREALLQKNRELESFASMAAHDLKEPLRMVNQFMHLLHTRYGDQLDEKAQQYIHFAMDGAVRMQTLINDLLEYAKAGSEESPIELIKTEQLLQEVLKLLDNNLAEQDAVVKWDHLPDVYGQPTALKLLFQNLISNGIKYQKKDTKPEISIAIRDQGTHWLVCVRDNGIGIREEYAEQIFQLFRRLHTRTEYAGTGMGLATCKKIVERHGGKIWVESVFGEGSSFYFTLLKNPSAESVAPKNYS
jgi:PAS domain S-box-containing protein